MPALAIKLTAKRQATFPAEVCQHLGVKPGDRIYLERRETDAGPAWLLRPKSPSVEAPWFGTLRRFGARKSHAMDDIRRSIGTKLEGEDG